MGTQPPSIWRTGVTLYPYTPFDRNRGFLMLTKRNTANMRELASVCASGDICSMTKLSGAYTTYVWVAPKVALKPARAVPMISNVFGHEALVVCSFTSH